MLAAVIDTNIIVNAILYQQGNEDCWEVLRLLRIGEFIPVASKQLFKEYNYALHTAIMLSLVERFKVTGYDEVTLKKAMDSIYNISCEIGAIFDKVVNVKVVSKNRICKTDPEDDKIVNLAIDANCQYIVTKNMSDFNVVNETKVKLKNGKVIEVLKPEVFCDLVKLDKWSKKSKA